MSIVDKPLTFHESTWLIKRLRSDENPVGNMFTETHFAKMRIADVLAELKKAGWKSASEDLVLRYTKRIVK